MLIFHFTRYHPSQSDVTTYEHVKSCSHDAKLYPHVDRWYRHIGSFSAEEHACWAGEKGASAFKPAAAAAPAAEDDDDIDLFGSDDEEDAEAARVREERLKAYAEKKTKKPGPIAKSSITFDVKPWDDETDMVELERLVRTIEMDGLVWGASKLVPVGYGIKKLRIICVVEDEKVSTDMLEEKIKEFEDHVQSVDIEAFAKI